MGRSHGLADRGDQLLLVLIEELLVKFLPKSPNKCRCLASANAITNDYSAWREPQQNSVSRLGIISDSESRGPRDR
jgi:hypothetical protein